VIPKIILTLPSFGMGENDPDPRTQQAIVAALQELKGVCQSGSLGIPERELRRQDRLQGEGLCG